VSKPTIRVDDDLRAEGVKPICAIATGATIAYCAQRRAPRARNRVETNSGAPVALFLVDQRMLT
jgi:hypothetical protein